MIFLQIIKIKLSLEGTIYLVTDPNIGKVHLDLLSLFSLPFLVRAGLCGLAVVLLGVGVGAGMGVGVGVRAGRGLVVSTCTACFAFLAPLGSRLWNRSVWNFNPAKKCQLFIYYDLKHLTTMMFEKHRTTDNSKTVVHY